MRPELRDSEWMRREYLVRKREPWQIAARLRCSVDTVTRTLAKFKIPLRPEAPARQEPTGPVDTEPVSERATAAPSGRCRCDRPLFDEDGLCCKCGK